MARKYSFGKMLAFGALTAVAGGVAAYKHRREIETVVQDITEQLDAKLDTNSVFAGTDSVVYSSRSEDGEPDSDFVEFHKESKKAQKAEEAKKAEEEAGPAEEEAVQAD